MRVRYILLLLSLLGVAYLVFWPVRTPFRAFEAEPAIALPPSLARDARLDAIVRMATVGDGPEDIAIDSLGNLYTGIANGHLYVFERGALNWRPITLTYGRPLGLAFSPDERWLYIADAMQGLMVTDKAGHLERLVDTFEGEDLGLVDDLAVAPDGTVYFTSATRHWGIDEVLAAALAHDRTGRLFAYVPRTKALTVVADSLAFANGVAVAPDGSAVYVAETTGYRVLRIPLAAGGVAGPVERFAERLPGFPDGLNFDGRGRLWVSIVNPRNPTLDRLADQPRIREAIHKLPDGFKPKAEYGTELIALSDRGEIVDRLSVSEDLKAPFVGITNAVWRGDTLYLGSLRRAESGAGRGAVACHSRQQGRTHHYSTSATTRRFSCRPAASPLEATGSRCPRPSESSRSRTIPCSSR